MLFKRAVAVGYYLITIIGFVVMTVQYGVRAALIGLVTCAFMSASMLLIKENVGEDEEDEDSLHD